MARMRGIHADVMRGSIAGNTFTANQFHQIIVRQRTSPVNPNTNRQSQIRSAMSAASVTWLSLTDAVRADWNNYAQSLFYPNPLGPIQVPGRQVFLSNIGTAKYLLDRGELAGPIATTPPVIPGFLGIGDVTYGPLAAPGTGFELDIASPNAENTLGFAFRSFSFNPTRYRYKGPWLTETLDSVSITGPTDGVINFTGLSDSMIYFCAVRLISAVAPFRLSPLIYIRCVADITAP